MAESPLAPVRTRLPDSMRWLLLALAVLLVASTLWKKGRLGDNSRSRFITVERLVERGTWAHVAPGDTTPFQPSVDVVKIGDRIYSSKPPLYPLIMAGEAKALKSVTNWTFYPHRKDYNRFLVFLNQVLPYVLMLWVAARWLLQLGASGWTQHVLLLGLSVGCLAYGYAPEINNHSPAAALLLILCHQMWRVWEGHERRRWVMGLMGLEMGLLMSLELPAIGIGLTLLGLLAWRDWRGALVALLPLLIPAVVSMVLYHAISGQWRPFYLDGKLYRFEGSYWTQPAGSDLLREPQGVYFLKALLGPKGLFSLTPLLLLLVPMLVMRASKRLPSWWKGMTWLIPGVVAILAYIGLRTHNYGGDCIGMRWYIVLMPLLLFSCWPMVQWLGQRGWGRVLSIFLLLLSVVPVAVCLYMDCFIDWSRL